MSRHEDLLLQLIQRDPDKIRSILGLSAPKPDLSWYKGADVWIEAGHRSDRGAELRIAFGEPLPNGYADFWIPFSGPDGNALGWLRFSYITTVREKSLFTASEWRSAGEPAPAEENRLDLPVDPLPGGFAPASSDGASECAGQQSAERILSPALRYLSSAATTRKAFKSAYNLPPNALEALRTAIWQSVKDDTQRRLPHYQERWMQAFNRRMREQTARLLEPLIDSAEFRDLVSQPYCPEHPKKDSVPQCSKPSPAHQSEPTFLTPQGLAAETERLKAQFSSPAPAQYAEQPTTPDTLQYIGLSGPQRALLDQLAQYWLRIAAVSKRDADANPNPDRKRELELKYMAHYNCAAELQNLLKTGELPSHLGFQVLAQKPE
ncbi:hypothetical protein, partial [Pseudomonas aeruginosa]